MTTQENKNVKIFAWFTNNQERQVCDDEIENAGGFDNLEFDKAKDGLEREFMFVIAPHAHSPNICCWKFEIEVYDAHKNGNILIADKANWDYDYYTKKYSKQYLIDYMTAAKSSDMVISLTSKTLLKNHLIS